MVAHLPILLHGVSVHRAGHNVIGPLNLAITHPGMTAVLGPNGAGKTTLLRLLHGLERARSGHIDWPADPATLRSAQAFVFQRPVMMRRSVLENLIYPLRIKGSTRDAAKKQAQTVLKDIDMAEKSKLDATLLSIGEQQRLAVARAFIAKPGLVFLDEPCASLDGATTYQIETLLRQKRDAGVVSLLSTHDLAQARRLADWVILLHKGKLIETAPAAQFFAGPATQIGRDFLEGRLLL